MPAILAVHAVKSLLAVALLGRIGNTLAATATLPAAEADAASILTLLLRAYPQWAVGAQWVVLAYLLMAPWLTQLVLAALVRPGSMRVQLRAASSRYARALGLGLWHSAALTALVIGAYVAAERLPALTPAGLVLEEIVRAACIGVSLLAALWLSTAFDLGAARLALDRSSALGALGRGARCATLRACAFHAACGALSLALFVASDVFARNVAWPMAAIALQQTLALLSTLARARWLARALDMTMSPNGSARTS
jgi:hypothetical protein